jgi:serine/threonine-protein kinase
MDAERWRRIDHLFAAALDLPDGERGAFLAAQCPEEGEDAEVRAAVERLLAADERAGTFLATSTLPPSAQEDDPAGRRLGPYTLGRCLGWGGMGAVYLATRDDGAYERQVAVKLLRWGLPDGDLRHRFLAERQILARLEHPHIARLYDAGMTEDGQPYLVMEYVEGLPLDEYCDAHYLSLEARIELFRRVCSAVQHAHRNLLVHRDLKPANVLVTAAGEPKLLDFGIAKQLSEAGLETRTGLRLMTPRYASPEQVQGEAVTTASDVYSLGVLLYELLAGRSPYPAADSRPSLERAVVEEIPGKPSDAAARAGAEEAAAVARARSCRPGELRRRLQGDLDNIVLMALRKEPERRYGSAAELEQDLERFLAQRPVRARRDSFGYRAGLFIRRHRWAVTVGATAALVIASLVAGLVAQSVRAARERDKAREALAFLVDVFKQSDPYKTGGERVTPQQILAEGATRVSRELQGQPEVQAALMNAIGEVYLGLGVPDKAEPLLAKALAQRRAVGADLQDIVQTLTNLANTYTDLGRLDEAEGLYQQALSIRRGRKEEAEEAQLLVSLSELEKRRAHLPAAEELCNRALALQRRVLGPRHPAVAGTLRYKALIRLDTGDHTGAEDLLREAISIQRVALEANHPDLVASINDLALSLHYQGQLADAEVLYKESLSLFRARFGDANPKVADLFNNIGSIAYSLRRTEEAARYHEAALAIRRKIYGERHMDVAQSLMQLGRARFQADRLDEAESLLRHSLEIITSLQGADHPLTAYPLVDLGQVAIERRRWKEAEGFYGRALEIRLKALPKGHFETERVRAQLGESLVRQGRYAEAEPLLRTALAALLQQLPPGDKRVLDTRARVMDLYQSWGKKVPEGL